MKQVWPTPACIAAGPYTPPAGANVLQVGPGQAYATIAVSPRRPRRDGDVLLVQAGTYVNDFARVGAKVSIIGVGGMVNMVATVQPPNGKAILTVDTDATIQNLAFSGCTVPDGNGAGIRYEGGSLTLQNCSFHDNENGLLSASVADGTLTIQNCDFNHNGSGTGYTHNLYVGAIKQLTVTASRFTGAVVGHEIKSRALSTTITGNVISDGPDGTASYSIDLPDGGRDVVSGNLIEKGPQAENQSIIHFGGEGIPYAGSSLLVQGNQITNGRGPDAIGVLNNTAIPVTVTGNSLTNLDPARISAGPARISGNLDSPGADGTGTLLPDAVLSGVLPGNTTTFTDALDHQVTMTQSGIAVQGGAGHVQVQADAGHVIVLGGAGGLAFTEAYGSGGNQVTTAAGSANTISVSGQDTIDSEGTDAITTGLGNVTAQVGGDASVSEGIGNNQWNVLGALHLTGHGGAPRLNLNAGSSASLDGALNFVAIQSNGGSASYDLLLGGMQVQASVVGGAWSMYGHDGWTSFITASGPDGATMHLGAGGVQIVSGGSDVIWAGSGNTVIQASGAAEIHAGTGDLAVFGRGWSGANIYGDGGTVTIDGDTGGVTYHGGHQDSTVQAKLSSVTLLGGAGHMTVQAGARQTITGGAGGITVNEGWWSGANTVTTAAGSTNIISLTNGTLDSWGNDTIVQPGGNNTLAIHGTATIQGSSGNSHLSIFGHVTLIGHGGDWLTLAAGADATVQAGGYLTATTTQAALRVTAPDGDPSDVALSVTGGSATVTVQGGQTAQIVTDAVAGGTAVTVNGGASSIQDGSGDQVHTGAGTATVTLLAGGAQVWGGDGQLTVRDWSGGGGQVVHGGGGSVTVDGGASDMTFIGGSGDAVLDGAAHQLTIRGGAGHVTVANPWARGMTSFVGGTGGADLHLGSAGGAVTFGSGNVTVQEIGWGDAVSYTATSIGGGTETIAGFRAGTDTLHLAGTSVADQSSDGTATVLTTTSGTRIVLQGVAAPVGLIVDPTPLLNPVLPTLDPVTQPAVPSAGSQDAPATGDDPGTSTPAAPPSADVQVPAAAVPPPAPSATDPVPAATEVGGCSAPTTAAVPSATSSPAASNGAQPAAAAVPAAPATSLVATAPTTQADPTAAREVAGDAAQSASAAVPVANQPVAGPATPSDSAVSSDTMTQVDPTAAANDAGSAAQSDPGTVPVASQPVADPATPSGPAAPPDAATPPQPVPAAPATASTPCRPCLRGDRDGNRHRRPEQRRRLCRPCGLPAAPVHLVRHRRHRDLCQRAGRVPARRGRGRRAGGPGRQKRAGRRHRLQLPGRWHRRGRRRRHLLRGRPRRPDLEHHRQLPPWRRPHPVGFPARRQHRSLDRQRRRVRLHRRHDPFGDGRGRDGRERLGHLRRTDDGRREQQADPQHRNGRWAVLPERRLHRLMPVPADPGAVRAAAAQQAVRAAGPELQSQGRWLRMARRRLEPQPGQRGGSGRAAAGIRHVVRDARLSLRREVGVGDRVHQHPCQARLGLTQDVGLRPVSGVAGVQVRRVRGGDGQGALQPGHAGGLVRPDVGAQPFPVRGVLHAQGSQVHAAAAHHSHVRVWRGRPGPLRLQHHGAARCARVQSAQPDVIAVRLQVQPGAGT